MTEASPKVFRQKVNITKEEQAYIDNVVMSVEFPWFWQDKQTAKETSPTATELNCHNGPYLSHSLLSRASSAEQSHVNRSADEFSWAYRVFANIFDKFCRDNQIEYSKIYRANLNLTWYNGEWHTVPHKDHDFDHKNFIMYLTNCDKGCTLVWSDDFSECVQSVCEKNVAITFDSSWHAHQYPLLGQKRLVFVLTYI